ADALGGNSQKISELLNARLKGLFSLGWPLLLTLAVTLSVVLVFNGSPKLQRILGWSILLGSLSLLLYFLILLRLRRKLTQLQENGRQADMGRAPRRD